MEYVRFKFQGLIHYFLIAESHLSPGIPADVHPAEEYPLLPVQLGGGRVPMVTVMAGLVLGDSATQFRLDGTVVLLIDDVVHRVTVYEEILLEKRRFV